MARAVPPSPLILRVRNRICVCIRTFDRAPIVVLVPLVVAVPECIHTCTQAEPEEAAEEPEAPHAVIETWVHARVVREAEVVEMAEGTGRS